LLLRRPPRPTLFPSRRSSDLARERSGRTCGNEISMSTTGHDNSYCPENQPLGGVVKFAHEVEEPAALVASHAQPIFACLSVTKADRKSTRLNSSHLVISYAVF